MKLENPLITVIVPVFNVEGFIKKCLDSILNQTFSNLQIILVDDGSTDNSGEICDLYAKKDDRIEVVHQNNNGVSAARNVGLSKAKGDYISFIDSDDVLPLDAYSTILSYAKENLMVIGNIKTMTEKEILLKDKKFDCREITQQEFLMDLFCEKKYPYLGYLFDKLFEKKIIDENHLRFDTRIRINEDRLFVFQYMLNCKKVIICNDIVYYYRQRNSGVILQSRNNKSINASEMTILISFDEMKKISKEYSSQLYYICSRKAFESALDLLKRVEASEKMKKNLILQFLWENGRICLQNPNITLYEKIKVLVHLILRR